jgi:hypothetical protein
MKRSRRVAGLALVPAFIAVLATTGPVTTASASCDTLANCAIEQAQTTASGAIATVQPYVDRASAFISHAESAAEQSATKRTLICAIQGRWSTPSSLGNGISDCFIYDGSDPTNPSKQGHESGTFGLWNADVTSGPIPVFDGNRNFGLDLGGSVTTPSNTENLLLEDMSGTPAYGGYWSDPVDGLGHFASAVIDLLPARTVDPNGGSDYFITGVITMVEPQLDTLQP